MVGNVGSPRGITPDVIATLLWNSLEHILVTGVAGFIGAKTTELLLDDGANVVGIDNLNDYYDVRLKHHRLESLQSRPNFRFNKVFDVKERG